MSLSRCAGALAIVTVLGPGLAQAGLDIDFGADVKLGDRTDLYVAISSRYFDHDRQSVAALRSHYSNPDDLAVALFISRHSGSPPEAVHRLRHQGLSWWDVSVRLGLPVEVWFVPVSRDPGPPYGKAYGHWKKHRGDRRTAVVLHDSDVRNLVAVRVLHEYYGVAVEVAMDLRADGRRLPELLSEEYVRRHGNADRSRSGNPGRGRGHAKGKGHKKTP